MFEANYIDVLRRRIVRFISSGLANVKAWWWGVKTDGSITCYGSIHFRRLPDSRIVIGKKCKFNSSENSNLIGVNRSCMISTLDRKANILIGSACGFSGTVIGAFSSITIGDNVKCGANTLITDSNWHPEDSRSGVPKAISIGNNVWLGVNSVVLKGVVIGENSLIGANSVVKKDINKNVVDAGNNCNVI
jgi:serine acetyltransferase